VRSHHRRLKSRWPCRCVRSGRADPSRGGSRHAQPPSCPALSASDTRPSSAMARNTGSLLISAAASHGSHPATPTRSPASDQAVGLSRGGVTSSISPYLALEAADCRAGQWPENTVHGPLIIIQATQRFLDLPSICFRHTRLCRQARRSWSSRGRRCWGQRRGGYWRGRRRRSRRRWGWCSRGR
jgi:hypothetical protein